MNREEYLTEFEKITSTMLETTRKKNADYSGSSDNPFHNFEMVEQISGRAVTTEQGFLTRMTDKIMRFGTFVKVGVLQVADEKVEDTLLDLAVYCILCVCYLRSKKSTGERIVTSKNTD